MASFGEDVLLSILSWLPAKTVCQHKSVCKSFMGFSKETFFSMKQTANMSLKDDTCFFVQPDIRQWDNYRIEVYSFPEDESSGVPKHSLKFLEKSTRVMASSNGLLLCRGIRESQDQKLFICNPVTQTQLPIAPPAMVHQSPIDVDINVIFKCNDNDHDLDDYRIILIDKPLEWSSHLDLRVYLPKEGVWEAVKESFFYGSRNMKFDMPVYIHNVLHFISDSFPYIGRRSPYFRPYIMAYNFESGRSTMLRLPKDARRGSHDFSCNMGIFEWRKMKSLDHSICLVRHMKFVFTIWILVDYKATLWRRMLKIRVKAMGLEEEDPKIQGFTIMNGDCLIFATEKKVYQYDLSGQRSRSLKVICKHEWKTRVCFTSYSNTLRPCGTGATTFPTHVTTQLGEDETFARYFSTQLSEDITSSS